MVFDQLLQAAQAAAPDRLGEVATAVWKAFGAGGLTEEQAEELDGLISARRGTAGTAPVSAVPLAAVASQLAPAVAPSQGERAPPAKAHPRTGSRPRTPESMARRRRWAASGYMPPALAAAFSPGELAALAVVACEIGKRGSCALPLSRVAAVAGVSLTTAKRALKQARLLGLVTVEERRLSRWRNDTNLVRVASREWAAWLRLRMPRGNHAGLMPPGGQFVPSTMTEGSKEGALSAVLKGRKGALQAAREPSGQGRAGQAPRAAATLVRTGELPPQACVEAGCSAGRKKA